MKKRTSSPLFLWNRKCSIWCKYMYTSSITCITTISSRCWISSLRFITKNNYSWTSWRSSTEIIKSRISSISSMSISCNCIISWTTCSSCSVFNRCSSYWRCNSWSSCYSWSHSSSSSSSRSIISSWCFWYSIISTIISTC